MYWFEGFPTSSIREQKVIMHVMMANRSVRLNESLVNTDYLHFSNTS